MFSRVHRQGSVVAEIDIATSVNVNDSDVLDIPDTIKKAFEASGIPVSMGGVCGEY